MTRPFKSDEFSVCEPISRQQIIETARAWAGTPYLHQASARGAGCDCLGLIRGVWRDLYGAQPEAPPPYTPDWNERSFRSGGEPLLEASARWLTSIEAPAPGSVLVFRVVQDGPAKHCGIATGTERFIHAYAGRTVVESVFGGWWRRRLAASFDFPGVE